MTQATAWAPIVKTEKQADGTLFVYGRVSDDTIDGDEQICDPAWLKTAVPDWYRTGGNVREQHSALAAGTAVEYEDKGNDGHWIKALVVDPTSVLKVDKKVLKGFSIGIKRPRVVIDKVAKGGRIVDGRIVEVSLVDRPCNPACTLTVVKADAAGRPVHVEQEFREAGVPRLTYALKTDERTQTLTAVALRALAELIRDEAADLADGDWSELYDLSNLINAVFQLQSFAYSEAAESTDAAAGGPITLERSVTTAAATAVNEASKATKSDTANKADTTTTDDATATADATKTEGTEQAAPEYLTKADVPDLVGAAVQDAVTKAVEPLLERLAKVEALPQAGGPQLVRPVDASKAAAAADNAQIEREIADLVAKSEAASDPALRLGYAQRADAKRALLTK